MTIGMLHITNGHSVSLGDTRLGGETMYWMDCLHEGPVPAHLTLEELSRVRENFLAAFFKLPLSEVSLAERDATLGAFRDHEEVVLWFEHDLYDQLQLIQILDWLASQDRGNARISMICVDQYLGHLDPGELEAMFPTRRTVSTSQYETAQFAWQAFRSPERDAIERLVTQGTPALPFLSAALARHLDEFPAPTDGLGRTERQTLHLLSYSPSDFNTLFLANQEMEDPIYLSDLCYRGYLERMSGAILPLIRPEDGRYRITTLGSLVLEGKENHVRLNGIDRWLGGVHLCQPPE